ncbi:MAG TPA: helix-turn-helix domain-containing protein [Solirubrobacterales bacterium]|nr:helix-turn-helix domain-containing protein [Solirubrobacterales bacterium]
MTRELGAALREAREARGIELGEVHRDLKIRLVYLRAMEEDRWDDLPGHAYARGFLATYAHYLGLEHQGLVDSYESGPGSKDEIEPIPADMLPQRGQLAKPRRLRVRRVPVAALVVIAVAGVMAWGLLSDSDPGEGEPAPERSAQSDQGDAAGATPGEDQDPAPSPAPVEEDGDASAGEDGGGGNGGRTTVVLKATGSVWVCVERSGGEALVDGEVLAAGDERGPFEPRQGQSLAIGLGNGSMRIEVDGDLVDVPATPDPIGYRVRDGAARELSAPQRPACV